MTPTRRTLLRTGGLVIAAGLAGCMGGDPEPSASADVSVREPFERDPAASGEEISVQLAVTLSIRTVDTTDGGLNGVEVVALDDEREVLATKPVGDFSYADADPQARRNSTNDDVLGSTTVYTGERDFELTIETPTVPAWLTFDVDGVRFGDETLDESAAQVVGRAAAAPPPPHLGVSVLRLQATTPLPSTVEPSHYAPDYVQVWRGDVDDGPYLPSEDRESPTRSPTPPSSD